VSKVWEKRRNVTGRKQAAWHGRILNRRKEKKRKRKKRDHTNTVFKRIKRERRKEHHPKDLKLSYIPKMENEINDFGLQHLVKPYHVGSNGIIKRPEHLIARWRLIFSFLDASDLNVHLMYLCRLFNDSLVTFSLSASSAGYYMHQQHYDDRFSAEMTINGHAVPYISNSEHNMKWASNLHKIDGGRGWNMMCVNPNNGTLRHHLKSYDTWGKSRPAVDKLAADLESVAEGDIVCLGIKDEGLSNLNQRFFAALKSICSDPITSDLTIRGSFALIGIKNRKGKEGTDFSKSADYGGRRVIIKKAFVKSAFHK